MLTKPAHGAPCNGCGQCCMDQRCPLGEHIFGPGGRCPALTPLFPAYVCGLIVHPEKYAADVAKLHGPQAAAGSAAYLVGAGHGCDAVQKGEAVNQDFRAFMFTHYDRDKTEAAVKIWGMTG